MTIDSTVSFSSLKLDNVQLSSLLQSLNVDAATIQKVLADPSIKILEVITAEQADVFKPNLPSPNGGNIEDIKPKQLMDLSQLFFALIELQGKQNELDQLQAKSALLSNKTTMDTSKESNRLTANAERWNAVATIAGGVLQVGMSAKAFKTLGSPPKAQNGVTVELAGNSSILAQKAMTYNSLGQAGSGLTSGFMSLFTTGMAQEGKNKASEAEYIKSNSDSIRSNIAALQKLMESAQSSVGSINNMISSVARY